MNGHFGWGIVLWMPQVPENYRTSLTGVPLKLQKCHRKKTYTRSYNCTYWLASMHWTKLWLEKTVSGKWLLWKENAKTICHLKLWHHSTMQVEVKIVIWIYCKGLVRPMQWFKGTYCSFSLQLQFSSSCGKGIRFSRRALLLMVSIRKKSPVCVKTKKWPLRWFQRLAAGIWYEPLHVRSPDPTICSSTCKLLLVGSLLVSSTNSFHC